MQPARIAELLAPFLGGEQLVVDDLQRISTYVDILQRWNARVNLTAIRREEEIVTRHFGESFFAARHLFPRKNGEEHHLPADSTTPIRDKRGRTALEGRVSAQEKEGALAPEAVADLGSGAGFPGIPLKLWAPQVKLTLIEANHKKAMFLREVARALTLTDINILSVRAETLTPGGFDLVTLRAVERFESVLPTASRLVVPGGRLALLIGVSQLQSSQHVLPDIRWSDPLTIPASRSRILRIGSHLRRTSE